MPPGLMKVYGYTKICPYKKSLLLHVLPALKPSQPANSLPSVRGLLFFRTISHQGAWSHAKPSILTYLVIVNSLNIATNLKEFAS